VAPAASNVQLLPDRPALTPSTFGETFVGLHACRSCSHVHEKCFQIVLTLLGDVLFETCWLLQLRTNSKPSLEVLVVLVVGWMLGEKYTYTLLLLQDLQLQILQLQLSAC
jgi:hypothetical protein